MTIAIIVSILISIVSLYFFIRLFKYSLLNVNDVCAVMLVCCWPFITIGFMLFVLLTLKDFKII